MDLLSLQIHLGLNPANIQRAAQLYLEALRRQIGPLIGADSRAIAFLRQSMNPQNVFSAHQDGEMIGLAGIQHENGPFLQPQLSLFVQHFGWLLGRIRFQQVSLYEQPVPAGQLLIHSIAVDPTMRGKGVGTSLINAVTDFASRRGFEAVSIHIPDTSPAMLHLCERLGFLHASIQGSPSLLPFGIQSFTTMTKTV
jgi:GNAT superfamily N-acetyltransferase